MRSLIDLISKFRWEPDNWWWELVRLDEIGIPAKYNFVIPDKLAHFLACFLLTWIFFRFGLNRHWAALLAYFLMMVPWEFIWDGCLRNGASSSDIVANTVGTVLCWWWLSTYDVVGQAQL